MGFWGFIIGAGTGFLLSTVFIFPPDILNIKLLNMTIGDILRILGGLLVVPLGGVMGARICKWFAWAIADFKMKRDARIEQYGKPGSSHYRKHLVKDRREE